MNQEILRDKFKIFAIVLFSLMFIVVIEGFVMMNDCTGILKNITVAPMDLVRYLPIIILLYLFSAEMIQTLNDSKFLLRFDFKKTGIVFFQDFHVWLAILETFSLEKIQTSELKQLKHLKTFSLEVNRKKKCVRVILYSKSIKELEERIRTSKPILEVVLPDIHFITRDDVNKLYSKTELLKIGNEYILKEKSKLSYPQFIVFPKKSSPSFNKIILACNISDEVKNKENPMNCVQMYYIHSFDQKEFFEYLNKRFFKPRETVARFQDIQELRRIRLSYQTNRRPFLSFQEGLDQFISALSLISLVPVIIETKEKHANLPFKKNLPKGLLEQEKTPYLEMNQICAELCNFPKENKLPYEEKVKRCKKRADFCQNLLENANFSSIIESLIKQENKIEQIYLISELRRHLTYQQLVCCFSHLSKQRNPEFPYQKLVNLIHVLFQSNNKANEVSNTDYKPVSSIFSNDGSTEKISPSLTQN